MAKVDNTKINEFIDWISGVHSITNRNARNTTIGGGAIRNVIQEHLRKPFVVVKDTKKNVKRLFSSQDAYNTWLNALEANDNIEETLGQKYKDLVLLEFDVPAPHTLNIGKLDGSSLTTINILDTGNRNADAVTLPFKWWFDKGGVTTAPVDVTLTIKDGKTNLTKGVIAKSYGAEYSMGERGIEVPIGNYLQTGSNKIEINIRSLSEDVSSNDVNVPVIINLIKFEIGLEYTGVKQFNNPYNWDVNNIKYEDLEFTVNCTKSIQDNVSLELSLQVDNNQPIVLKEANWIGELLPKRVKLINGYEPSYYEDDGEGNLTAVNIKHNLQIVAHMESIDGTISFNSNTLLYTFENSLQDQDDVINNAFINIAYSTNNPTTNITGDGLCLRITQYNEFRLRWGYYTDGTNTSVEVNWKIVDNNGEYSLAALEGDSGNESQTLIFIPEKVYTDASNAYLVATINDKEVFRMQLIVDETKYGITFGEYPGYVLKLNAFGRSNNEGEQTRNTWEYNTYTTTFSENFPFDSNNGWYNNTLILSDESCYATVNFNPFTQDSSNNVGTKGRTIEIDFKTLNVQNESDELIIIGDKEGNGAYIIIYPSKASLFIGGMEVMSTNFKSNERIQLMFIFMRNTPRENESSSDPNLGNIYIVNNGILERGYGGANYTSIINNNSGNIKFGGSNSGISIYNTRVWYNDMSIYNAFLNFLADASNKSEIIIRNSIAKQNSSDPDYEACKSVIHTFKISGDLTNILNAGSSKKASNSAVNIEYTSPYDQNLLGFEAQNVRIRKHGQSTLNYPLTSFKIWLNKSVGDLQPNVAFHTSLVAKTYVKNRYGIRKGSIPANKFVLQANYADSSGVHNGGLLRLINDTWFNAVIDGEYKLRTWPQLFSTGKLVNHNNAELNETGSSAWVEGYGNTDYETPLGLKSTEHGWPELAKEIGNTTDLPTFPFQIRNAPDSLPAVVFYQKTIDSPITYLGQFVLMDDKKSDHIYGERSIYLWQNINDPFCMTDEGANTMVTNKHGEQKKGYDRDFNCVWENKNVLRVECVLINTTLTSFMDYYVSDTIEVDEDGNPIGDGTGSHAAHESKMVLNEKNELVPQFYWEDYFELIYPDEEDWEDDNIERGITKATGHYKTLEERNDPNFEWPENTSKFIKNTQPWIEFLQWICGIGSLNVDGNGNHYIDGTVKPSVLEIFKQEAHDHLDLYKLAAYYIFYIRFGLVDSVERNAQFKTYDGQHWFCEPWDMDIALGNKNTGGLVYDPPLNRDTRMPGKSNTWAYSGRSTTTSNILWDCLEAWDYWMETIVPKVADALYKAGLNYQNITEMFDEEYANNWSELLYNNSGLYKYVTAAQSKDWLGWLQGSRMSHRHWWVSKSLNYYDSKWTCGEFNESRIYLAVNKAQGEEAIIRLYPSSDTFFKLTQKDTTSNLGLISATIGSPAVYNLTNNAFSAKDPTHIFGVLFLEKLDLGKFAIGVEKMVFQNAVDTVLGATIKEINIGNNYDTTANSFSGWVNNGDISISNTASIEDMNGNEGSSDALENVETFNATGQLKIQASTIITQNRSKLKNIYAAGTSLTTLTSSSQGNKFNELHLPGYNIVNKQNGTQEIVKGVQAFDLKDSSWTSLSFWSCSYNDEFGTITMRDEFGNIIYETDPETGEDILDEQGNKIPVTYEQEQNAQFNKLERIPEYFNSVKFEGSTASNACSIQFILDWFDSIEYYVQRNNPSLTGDDLEEAVLAKIKTCTAQIDKIRWNYGIDSSSPKFVTITYKDIIRLAHLNGGYNETTGVSYNASGNNFKGYIKISDQNMQPWQLAELTKYFGEKVFDIGSISSNLVIDQQQQYAQISVSNNIYTENDRIYCYENKAVRLKCTKFLLTNESVDDYTWTAENVGSHTLTSIGDGAYMQLVVDESVHENAYPILITARNKNTGISAQITLYVIPVTVSNSWSFSWTGSLKPREFISNEIVAESLFGNYVNTVYNGATVKAPIYIFNQPGISSELVIKSDIQFDATVTDIKFKCQAIYGNAFNVTNETLSTVGIGSTILDAADSLNTNEANQYVIDLNHQLLKVIGKSTNTEQYTRDPKTGKKKHNSVTFESYDSELFASANDMLLLSVTAIISYKSPSIEDQIYRCNIIIFNDPTPIVTNAGLVGQKIIQKLQTDYPSSTYYQGATQLYKSDLLSLQGTLTYQDLSNIGSFGTFGNSADSIFNYMPNLTVLTIDNCSGITWNGDADKLIDLSKLSKLTSITIKNSGFAAGTNIELHLSNSSYLTSIDCSGSNTDVVLNNLPNLTTIKLGTPKVIEIKNCDSIVLANCTCESVNRLDQLSGRFVIENNSNSNSYAFALFDKFYNLEY